MSQDRPLIHPSAEVSPQAKVGAGSRIWHHAQVREGASLGINCILGKGAYVDAAVRIGNNVKVQNNACLYHGVEVEDGVFVGPGAIVTNDRLPRAINPDGTLKSGADWDVTPTLIKRGASIGAGAIVLAGVTVGAFALVGAGSIVTHDVPDHGLVFGNPARHHGYVCRCARALSPESDETWYCAACDERYRLPQH
jgi:acetyltransferase-like isoleucine patch superfamily enzyme